MGCRGVHAELLEGGCQVGRKRVARLMRESGLVGVSRRRGTRTTRSDRNHRAAPDRVERQFRADAPDRLWVADLTYVPTWNGFVYLAIVLDVYSRKVVGWSMANHLRTELVLEALNMAIGQRRPQGVIHHSDKGAQYTSLAFGKRCRDRGIVLSSGLRLSEACRLTGRDVDLADGVLTVRESKFRKSRLVPLHSTVTRALARYVACRNACRGVPRSEYFFRTDRVPALTRAAVQKTFSRLRNRLGWTATGRTHRPRIHEFRHTFAVRRLLRWYEDGADVDRKILALATYLGHAKVTDTYWYLSASPELMAITSQRFERFAQHEQERAS